MDTHDNKICYIMILTHSACECAAGKKSSAQKSLVRAHPKPLRAPAVVCVRLFSWYIPMAARRLPDTYSNHRMCVLGRSVYCICATNLAGSSHAQANMSTMEGRLAELLVSAVSGAGDTVAVPVLEYARHVLLLSWERSERSCVCQCVRILGCVGGDLSVHTCVRGPCKMLPQ